MVGRLVAGQFRNPTGFFGKLIGNVMAKGNEPASRWTVSLLNLQPDSRILEVGFGPGIAIQYASKQVTKGLVAGIDASETMVQAARKRNAAAIATGKVDLKLGRVSSIPYPDEFFDRAFTIHCIYFWANPIEGLQELQRVLKPGGLLAVTILPKDKWNRPAPPDLFTLYNGSEVAQLLKTVGFREVRVENCAQSNQFSGVCVLGIK